VVPPLELELELEVLELELELLELDPPPVPVGTEHSFTPPAIEPPNVAAVQVKVPFKVL